MPLGEVAAIAEARSAFANSLFAALARLKSYVGMWKLELPNVESVTAAATELAGAAAEMDVTLRAVIRLQFPNPERVDCPEYAKLQDDVPSGKNLLNHLLQCSPCYEEFSSMRTRQGSWPVAHDLLWTLLMDRRPRLS
ncbi:MAG: hypothetical protein ACRD7E_12505 [Bryobacteraceae bacterium]